MTQLYLDFSNEPISPPKTRRQRGSRLLQILQSGDHESIARKVHPDIIVDHFGVESPEFLAYERSQIGKSPTYTTPKDGINKPVDNTPDFSIPRMTEDPRVNSGMMRRWLIDFYDNNKNLDKPRIPGDKAGRTRVFNKTLTDYSISIGQIIPNDKWED